MHIIRLRRPWEKQLVGSPTLIRIDVPEPIGSLLVAESTFLYRRRFNQPSGLDSGSQVHLKISGWTGQIESITLNGCTLKVCGKSVDIAVTDLLQPTNVIELILRATADQVARLSGEVTLTIT